jgi:hypothetical protein
VPEQAAQTMYTRRDGSTSESWGTGTHGRSEHGTSMHGDGCECKRCDPQKLVHGGYALIALSERQGEIAAELRERMPWLGPSDQPILDALVIVISQIESTNAAQGQVDTASRRNPVAQFIGEPGERFAPLRNRQDQLIARLIQLTDRMGGSAEARLKLGMKALEAEAQQIDLNRLKPGQLATFYELYDAAVVEDES